jgi:hypothetical protein
MQIFTSVIKVFNQKINKNKEKLQSLDASLKSIHTRKLQQPNWDMAFIKVKRDEQANPHQNLIKTS